MKRIILSILLIVCSLFQPVSAESSTTVVTYTPQQTYNWSISSSVVNLNSSSSMSVNANQIRIERDNELVITVDSVNDWKLKYRNDEIDYSIYRGDIKLIDGAQVLQVQSGHYSDTYSQTINMTLGTTSAARYSNTYSDTLIYTAKVKASGRMEGLTKLNLSNERTVMILDYLGDDKYLVIERNSIGNKPFHTADSACGINSVTSGCDNTYENSELDVYLNGTWYNSLSSTMKNAIVDAEIYQEFYTHSGSQLLHCANTNSSTRYTKDTDGDGVDDYTYGSHPFEEWNQFGRTQTWNSNAQSNTITRKVFLPSLKEIIEAGVDLNNYDSTRSFLTEASGSLVHLWTRDGDASSRQIEMLLNYYDGSPGNNYLWNTGIGVRPAYIIDLSKIAYSVMS